MRQLPGADLHTSGSDTDEAFRLLFHRMPIASMLAEAATSRVIDVNPAFEDLFGWRPDNIINQLSSEFPLWASKKQRQQLLNLFTIKGRLVKFEGVLRCRSGELKTCLISMESIVVHGVECRLSMAHDITARIHTERELKVSQEKYHKAFNASHDAVLVMDLQTELLVEANNAFQILSGLAAQDAIGHTLPELGIIDRASMALLHSKLSQTGRVRDHELSIRRSDGASRDIRLYAEPVMVAGNNCLVMTAHDITEQKLRDTALRESQERLNMALEAAQMGIWDWSPSSGMLHCSARAAALHGRQPVEWNGPLIEFMTDIPAKHRRQLRRSFIAICRGQQSYYRLAYSLQPNNGGLRWLEVTATLHRNTDGSFQRMVGTLKDITEQRRSEQALMRSEAKFSALFQGSPDPYILVNASTQLVIEINQSFSRIFGYSLQDIIGKTALEVGFWRNTQDRAAIVAAIERDNGLESIEIDFLTREGLPLTCEVSSRFITINRQLCMLSTFKDITARKQAEAALRASEDKFARAFKASPDSISISEKASGRHLEINEGFTRLTGFCAAEAIGKTAREMNIWADYSERTVLIDELERYGRVRQKEMRINGKFGQELLVSVSIEPVVIENVDCMLLTARDITEQKLIEARVKHLAYHDALTDLPNRLLLTDRLEQNLAACERHGETSALLFFDLDHFKHINDSLGHSCGDAVLREVTRRLLAQVRKVDTVARLGGDEFVVLLCGLDQAPDTLRPQALHSAQKLLTELSSPMLIEGHSLHISCSIGIALLPEHGSNPDDLLKRADIALYKVKENGRNGIAFFEQAMQIAASERLSVETELRVAVSKCEFVLFYQPQFDALEQRIVGAEALIRWMHPSKGLTSPTGFIHVLEESGMILEVGTWVLGRACQFIAELLRQGHVNSDEFSLSVNISPRQFRQPDFVEQVRHAIDSRGVPARCLKLEITENIIIQNINDTVAKMQELRDTGVRFALDDFGTGYSSLSYLKRLPLDLLKIDQSFIRDCTRDANDAEIVRAIIAMARNLRLELIAEGVETQEQLDFLQTQSCHAFQGYLYSPPVSEEDFVSILRRGAHRLPVV
ncbi:EAL domain-containing protein [Halopseudomonas pelagia]|uniref:EAL domain-containing protein n=1 Tax=Halopseudomonas pelagia TaxID=553151 RepID=UPI0030DCE134